MSYVKQNFASGQTLTADQLNHMEDGIAAASETTAPADTSELEAKIFADDTDVPGAETLMQGKMVVGNGYTGTNAASDAHMGIAVTRGRTIKIENAYCAYSRCICAYDADGSFVRVLATDKGTDPYSMTVKVTDFDQIAVTSKTGEAISVSYVDGLALSDDFNQAVMLGLKRKNQFAGLATTPICCIIDDDTPNAAAVDMFTGLMEQNGVPGTLACITSRFEVESDLKAKLLEKEQAGHQVVLHCYQQIDAYKNAAAVGDDNYKLAEADFVHGLKDLHDAGFANYKYWVTPFGLSNLPLRTIAQKWGMECLIKSASTDYNRLDGKYSRWNIHRCGLNPTDTGALT